MTTSLPLGEVKAHLSELVGRVHDHHERITVTVHGRPSAMLIAVEDIEQLEVAAAAYGFITGPLLNEPYRVGKRLLPPLDDRFSARRGTYRIIYRIDDARALCHGLVGLAK
jgi:prevent-host-death family protein